MSTEVPHMDKIGKTAILSLYTVISAGFVTCTHMCSGLELCMHHITKVDKLSHIEKSTLNFQITKLKPLPTFPGIWYRGWNYSQTSDIFREFVALVRTKINMFCQAVWTTNAHARVIAAQSLDVRLAHGYTASKCSSRYPVMKRSRSYCQTVTWLYRQTVSQSSHVTAWHSRSYCSTHFWYVSCFAWLAVHWQMLWDHDGHLLAV